MFQGQPSARSIRDRMLNITSLSTTKGLKFNQREGHATTRVSLDIGGLINHVELVTAYGDPHILQNLPSLSSL